ncbi:ribose-phosphate pyrophosphokinase 1-like protein [Blastocladiella britannica]|nr:ribose-phosphate pyrophosphokinase 1-like protein [Blastocladiella britannica]
MRNAKIIAGTSHPDLAQAIIEKLGTTPTPLTVKQHSNHETSVDIGVSVRNDDIFIVQSGSDNVNDSLMELMVLIHSCRISSAQRITAVLPYFPYSKQSKKKKARGAVTAKLIANMLTVSGVDHVVTLDLHHEQMQGFFSKPVDNLQAEPTLCKYIAEHIPDYTRAVVVSKNPGGVKRVTQLADRLKIDFALIHQRDSKGSSSKRLTDQVVEVFEPQWHEDGLQLVGDVAGRPCFLVDDILDKASGFIAAARLLRRRGASRVYVLATHGLLSGDALTELEACDAVYQVIVTNSYPISTEKQALTNKLRIIDISGVLAEAIRRTHNGESISYLFHTAL